MNSGWFRLFLNDQFRSPLDLDFDVEIGKAEHAAPLFSFIQTFSDGDDDVSHKMLEGGFHRFSSWQIAQAFPHRSLIFDTVVKSHCS